MFDVRRRDFITLLGGAAVGRSRRGRSRADSRDIENNGVKPGLEWRQLNKTQITAELAALHMSPHGTSRTRGMSC